MSRSTTYDFSLGDLAAGSGGPEWLEGLRAKALQTHRKLGVPTPAQEEWKYTPLKSLGETTFGRPKAGDCRLPDKLPGSLRFVVVDGAFRADLSDASPPGATVCCLQEALESDLVRDHLGAAARIEEHSFAALNTAMFEGGTLVHLPKGAMVEPVIEVVHFSTGGACAPRLLVVAEEGSCARLVEVFYGGERDTLVLPVTEVFVAAHANLEHVRVQDETEMTHHIALWQVRQEGDSEYRSYNVCYGAKLGRVDQSIWLGGRHVTTRLDGVVVAKGVQHLDNHTRLDHAFPDGNSFEIYKQIVDDRATVVFNGQIYVHPDAQKTDAKQTNQALLLSPEATINSKPQLEIFADDVKCTHGATVGAPENDSLFYLRSRGVPRAEAQALLVYAFAAEVLELISVEALRERLEARLYAKLGI